VSVDPELLAAAVLATLSRHKQAEYAGREQDLFDAIKKAWPGDYSLADFSDALTALRFVNGASRSERLTADFVRVDSTQAVKNLRNPPSGTPHPRKRVPLLWEYGQFGEDWLRSVWPGTETASLELDSGGNGDQGAIDALPPNVNDLSGGRVLAGPTGSMENVEGRPGDILFEYSAVEPELLPASDRLVPLDHNSAPYLQVKEGLAELYEELRTTNDLACPPEERERLLASLIAAQKLWDAAQLKIIQIRVGIIITIDDAVSLLSKVGKAVGKAALIDAVKWIVKHATGVEL
jgi:hypothetical protein